MSELHQRTSDLSPAERRAFLATLLRERVSRPRTAPVSYAQRRLWFLDQLDAGNSAYNIPAAVRLGGVLDVQAFKRAFVEIVRRHEILRTTFTALDGAPHQVIHPADKFLFAIHDLSEWSRAGQEKEIERLATAEARQPFDLQIGPLLRVCLLRMGHDDHVLLFSMHHIISDGWSMNILIRELQSLYLAFSTGQPSPLPELGIQYSDYARWQRQWLQEGELNEQLEYWREQLGGAPPFISFPSSRPRPPVQTFRGAARSFELPEELSNSIRALSQRHGVTHFMTLLTAFQILLYRYAGQSDVMVGTPIANRNRAQVEDLIGLFANTLVLRVDLAGNPNFIEVLGRAREVALGAYAHQDVPFEKLVEELQPERNLSYTPLFQVMISVQNAAADESASTGLTLEPVGAENLTAKFDLTLSVLDSPTSFRGAIEYNSDLFDGDFISRLSDHFQVLLQSIVRNEEERIGELALLTAVELAELKAWNERERDCRSERLLHEYVEEQARQRPEAWAVVSEDGRLNYRELNERGNQLAHYLQRQGVGAETIVGLSVQRGVTMAVGVLGILKAGGAYVPLDPGYPEERLEYMVQDSGARVVVTEGSRREKLEASGAVLVAIDEEWETIEQEGKENPQAEVQKENLAYVIYTSGSTGKPKGVGITHASAAVLVEWSLREYEEAELKAVLAGTSLNFDLSIFELFVTWGAGQLVVVAENVLEASGIGAREGVTLINSVPSAVKELVRSGGLPKTVRTVNLAGEALGRELVEELYEAGVERVYNLYGPSEDTTYSTYGLQERGGVGAPLIGRPIGNTEVYVLDERQQRVAVGVIGELYIGGAGLGRGYLGRAELTAEKFVADGVSGRSGARLYRTGDLVRWRAGGDLEYLGRADEQVKVRGFRIELGEIEERLREREEVREAVVVVKAGAGEQRLVGYVVLREEEEGESGRRGEVGEEGESGRRGEIGEERESGRSGEEGGEKRRREERRSGEVGEELRRYLREWLPEHMTPQAIVVLAEMPLTPNGKIDKKALPEPEAKSASELKGTQTAIEELVGNIWSEVLGVERVGVSDNFFELGGHSLLATRVVSRVRETFHVELPVRVLFERPTVAELAAQVETSLRKIENIQAPPIRVISRDRAFPLSFAQQRLWFIDELNPSIAYTIPAAYRLSGPLYPDVLRRSLSEIVRRHEALRTTFAVIDGEAVQILHHECEFDLPLSDISELDRERQEAECERLVAVEVERPFNLRRYPLLRATLIRLSEDEHIAVFTIHHIISDGWSLGVFIRELTELYSAYVAGHPSPLPDLPFQFVDFAVWQREWLRGEVLDRQLGFWKDQLKDGVPVLELPTDHPRPQVQSYRGDEASLILDADTTRLLRQFSRRQSVTLFISLLAIFKLLLFRYTRQSHVIVGTAIANRTRTETENLIGLFINTLALSTRLSGEMSFESLLKQVRETVLGAHTHQDLPLERLIDELQLVRTPNRTPLFQVMFSLQNLINEGEPLTGINMTPVKSETKTAKFDLDLAVVEMPDALRFSIRYNTDLFDVARIDRMLTHYRNLIEVAISNPLKSIDQLGMITELEREQLLRWNNTKVEFEQVASVVHLFEEQVRAHGGEVAVVAGAEELSYEELNKRANRLAHYLRKQGVGAEQIVGIYLERSLEMVVGILGVVKSGGAYLPLDVSYPKKRISHLLEEQVSVLLTRRKLLSELSVADGTKVLCVEELQEVLRQESEDNPEVEIGRENLAYVIYTSGSTGEPKGVMIEHGSLVNLMQWHVQEYGIRVGERVTQMASPAFDAAVWEIWSGLSGGARLYLTPEGVRGDVERLQEWLTEKEITVSFVPTPLAELLLRSEWAEQAKLRVLLTGGDQLHGYRGEAKFEVVNHYGPTEATVLGTSGVVERRAREAGELPDIGGPIANVEVYVLDEEQQLAPQGVVGELYLGGVGVGRGYLGRAELTGERFVPDGVSGARGGRLYRTGDQARWRAAGELEYLGRMDEQVKIRGFRIELGEIEAALNQHPAIAESAVVVHEQDQRDKRLIAYVVASSGRTPNRDEMLGFLRDRLPEYMLPALLIVLPELPLTSNGKVDRRALPLPEDAVLPRRYVPPDGPLQRLLAAMWKGVLGANQIGSSDDFFELGGDSIKGAIFINQLREKLGEPVKVAAIFKASTIERLADFLRQEYPDSVERLIGKTAQVAGVVSQPGFLDQPRNAKIWSPLVEIQQGKRSPLFFVHPVGGNVFCYLNLARQLGPEYTVYGLQARGLDPNQAAQTQIDEMASYYLESLRNVQPHGPYSLAGWSMGGMIAFEMARQLDLQGEEVSFLGLIDSTIPSATAMPDENYDQRLLVHFATELGLTRESLTRPLDEILSLDFEEQMTCLLDLAKSAKIVPDGSDLTYLRNLFRVFRNNFNAAMSYQPASYPGKLTLLLAQERLASAADPEAIWRALARGGVNTISVPGNHYSMFRLPQLQTLAGQLKVAISEAETVAVASAIS